jgi:hypothetical protein
MDAATKRRYMLETAKTAFRPFDVVEAQIYEDGQKLRFRVRLPEPHTLPPALDWETGKPLLQFIDALQILRGMIKMKGFELEPWEPPPPPTPN